MPGDPQSLRRRVGSQEELGRLTDAWRDERNDWGVEANWRLTTADARAKLAHLYP